MLVTASCAHRSVEKMSLEGREQFNREGSKQLEVLLKAAVAEVFGMVV